MSLSALSTLCELLRPHVLATALCMARVLPASLLCPLFGGAGVPVVVRLGVALALSLHVHLAGGAQPGPAPSSIYLIAFFSRELLAGVSMGLVAALPLDAARMGGRLLDQMRGASAEAQLPSVGSRESATGDLLHQLLCALAFASGAYRAPVAALLGSFRALPLGAEAWHTEGALSWCLSQALAALAAGLAIGAPVAATSLLVDTALGFAAKAAPQLGLQEVGTPAKLMLGGAALLFALASVSARLMDALGPSARAISVMAAEQAFGGRP